MSAKRASHASWVGANMVTDNTDESSLSGSKSPVKARAEVNKENCGSFSRIVPIVAFVVVDGEALLVELATEVVALVAAPAAVSAATVALLTRDRCSIYEKGEEWSPSVSFGERRRLVADGGSRPSLFLVKASLEWSGGRN